MMGAIAVSRHASFEKGRFCVICPEKSRTRDVYSEVMTLDEKDVHIWLAVPTEHRDPEVLKAHEVLLSPDERVRYRRFRFARHRRDFLVAHALVRNTLSLYAPVQPADWQFVFNEHRRPEIADQPYREKLHFNLSHTDGLVALAVAAQREVGVDVESFQRHRINLDVTHRYFAPAEAEALFDLPHSQQARRFLQLWTLKESYIKARGMGLALPLRQFAFTDIEDTPRITFSADLDDQPSRWQFSLRTIGEAHLLALAIEASPHESMNIVIRPTGH